VRLRIFGVVFRVRLLIRNKLGPSTLPSRLSFVRQQLPMRMSVSIAQSMSEDGGSGSCNVCFCPAKTLPAWSDFLLPAALHRPTFTVAKSPNANSRMLHDFDD
jgi:hypothetical protein